MIKLIFLKALIIIKIKNIIYLNFDNFTKETITSVSSVIQF